MSSPCQSACSPWTVRDDLPCSTLDPDLLDDAVAAATDLLFQRSGRQFPGFCRDVVRPNGRYLAPPTGVPAAYAGEHLWLYGRYLNGLSFNGNCGCNAERTGCHRLSEITLGVYPVDRIEKVTVDGVELQGQVKDSDGNVTTVGQYRVDDFRYLVRLPDPDGGNPGWPCCSRMDLEADQPGTFEVQVVYGKLPDNAGVLACKLLACEIARALSGDKCALPDRVTQVVRQGVTIDLANIAQALGGSGSFGIPMVDQWLQAVNPGNLRRRARVVSPDIPRRVRRTGT